MRKRFGLFLISLLIAATAAGQSRTTGKKHAEPALAPFSAGRIVRALDQDWRFSPDDKKGFENSDLDDSQWQKVNLPHTWNDKDAFDDEPGYRRGPSWY